MDQHPLLEMHLRSLRLPTMLANYRRIADEVAEPIRYLTQLASLEIEKRHENCVRARVAAAHFPAIKTITLFEINLQPQLPKVRLLELVECRFIEHCRFFFMHWASRKGENSYPLGVLVLQHAREAAARSS